MEWSERFNVLGIFKSSIILEKRKAERVVELNWNLMLGNF